jgi:hypothetical protein
MSFCAPLQNDTGYTLWSFQGRQMQKVMMDKFYQLLWRPRPPTLLSDDEIRVCVAVRVCGVASYLVLVVGQFRRPWPWST